MSCNHKPKGICKIKTCKKKNKSKGRCSICGKTTFSAYCGRHRANGSKKPQSKSHKRCNNRRKAKKNFIKN